MRKSEPQTQAHSHNKNAPAPMPMAIVTITALTVPSTPLVHPTRFPTLADELAVADPVAAAALPVALVLPIPDPAVATVPHNGATWEVKSAPTVEQID
jgi:hypothetical protein